MTRLTSARTAGVMYLLYIALALPSGILYGRATSGGAMAFRLAHVAEHAAEVRIAVLLTVLTCFVALALTVSLYGITRDEDHELAVFALCCRLGEGFINAIAPVGMLAVLWIATATGPDAPDPVASRAIASYLLKQSWASVGALLFAVGSTVFTALMLRGRMIPIGLAWLGVIASVILDVCLPLQLVGLLRGMAAQLIWLPMAAFEIPAGVWLIVRGVRPLAGNAGTRLVIPREALPPDPLASPGAPG
jgi:hypothetical protein